MRCRGSVPTMRFAVWWVHKRGQAVDTTPGKGDGWTPLQLTAIKQSTYRYIRLSAGISLGCTCQGCQRVCSQRLHRLDLKRSRKAVEAPLTIHTQTSSNTRGRGKHGWKRQGIHVVKHSARRTSTGRSVHLEPVLVHDHPQPPPKKNILACTEKNARKNMSHTPYFSCNYHSSKQERKCVGTLDCHETQRDFVLGATLNHHQL